MRQVRIRAVVVVACAVALCAGLLITRWRDRTRQPELFAAPEINLPEVESAKPLGPVSKYAISLNVNAKGQVLLPPNEREPGKETLDTPLAVHEYMRQKARIQTRETTDTPSGPVILRIDRETPFGKAYGTLKACAITGYEGYQLRVKHGTECQLDLFHPVAQGGPTRLPGVQFFVVRVAASHEGELAGISFRDHFDDEDDIGEGEVRGDKPTKPLGNDIYAAFKQISQLADSTRQRVGQRDAQGRWIQQPELILEVDERLLHDSVAKLIHASLQAGFTKVWPVPFELMKR